MTTPNLYEKDFNLWLEQTVNQLKKGNLTDLDIDNLIEEIDSIGRSDKREIYSRLKALLIHLLKWKYQPEKRTPSWVNTIDEQRDQLELIQKDSPSLTPYFREILLECYQKAVRAASNETHLSPQIFPADCPFNLEQILNPDYLPQ